MKKPGRYEEMREVVKDNKHLDNRSLIELLMNERGFTLRELEEIVVYRNSKSEVK